MRDLHLDDKQTIVMDSCTYTAAHTLSSILVNWISSWTDKYTVKMPGCKLYRLTKYYLTLFYQLHIQTGDTAAHLQSLLCHLPAHWTMREQQHIAELHPALLLLSEAA